jgi:hypothetical protein
MEFGEHSLLHKILNRIQCHNFSRYTTYAVTHV